MSRGNITRRGKNSWRLKFELGTDGDGRRQTRFVTVKGKRQVAERELTRLLGAADAGTLVETSKTTISEYIRTWLGGTHGLAAKTVERYRQLAEQQIIPHLGNITLQKLRPATVAEWHGTLIKAGGKDGRALSARTVGHAHRLLHRALQRALETEVVSRNVAAIISPPPVEAEEAEILDAEQIATVLSRLEGHEFHPIAALALATGGRRGELLALQLGDVDLDRGLLKIERSLEQTKAGLRVKPPKTARGRRTISLPPSTVAVLREHRRRQLELRLVLGLGRPGPGTLLFSEPDGSPTAPDKLSWRWRNTCVSLELPRVNFHALRHTHASLLIASGLDVVVVSRRLGHASPNVTLAVYAHLFSKDDSAAADAFEATLRTHVKR